MLNNALYFSPYLDGHRASYCQYFLKILIKYFKTIFVVTNNTELSPVHQAMLQPFIDTGQVKLIRIKDEFNISTEEFIALQDKLKVDLTIIQEADNYLSLFNQQIKKDGRRLRGKNIGIFLRSYNYIYRRQIYSSPWSYWKDGVHRWKHIDKRWDADSIFFHEFLLPKFHLLDRAICLDEYFVNQHRLPHVWMPDIYFSLEEENSTNPTAELARYQEPFERFIVENREREKILYFGAANSRRGFDTLLKLAIDENGCFIHCGLATLSMKYQYNVEDMKALLNKEGRFFEIDAFLLSRLAVKMFFQNVNYVVMPYHRHLGSSGVMLLALNYGKPVLVPDIGLMAKRVKDNSLGMVYRHESYEDLRNKFIELKNQPIDQYRPTIQKFMTRFTNEQILGVIEQLILDINNKTELN